MDAVEPTREIRCDGCRQITPSYDIVHYGSIEQGYRQICSQCFNTEVAQLAGLEGFEHAKFEPVGSLTAAETSTSFTSAPICSEMESRSTLSSFATEVRLATNSRSSEIRRRNCWCCLDD